MRRQTCVLLLAFAVTAPGCVFHSTSLRTAESMPLHLDEGDMRAEVLRHVEVGMSVEEARLTMEAHGFWCRYDRAVWDSFWDGGDSETVYLFCSRCKPQPEWWGGLFRSDEVEVRFTFKAGVVTDIRVRHKPTCV